MASLNLGDYGARLGGREGKATRKAGAGRRDTQRKSSEKWMQGQGMGVVSGNFTGVTKLPLFASLAFRLLRKRLFAW